MIIINRRLKRIGYHMHSPIMDCNLYHCVTRDIGRKGKSKKNKVGRGINHISDLLDIRHQPNIVILYNMCTQYVGIVRARPVVILEITESV